LFTLSDHGESRNLFSRSLHTCFWWRKYVVLDGDFYRVIHFILGCFYRYPSNRFKSITRLFYLSQLGLIMSLFGVGSLSFHPSVEVGTVLYSQAVFAALFHLINHSTFKGALFMVIGIIDYKAGSRDL